MENTDKISDCENNGMIFEKSIPIKKGVDIDSFNMNFFLIYLN
jgi:hypothetical protein